MEDSPMQVDDEADTTSEADVDDGEDDDESTPAIGRRGRRTGRGVNLSMLLSDGILQPSEGALTIDYLGKKFVGDLLSSGKIRWQETRQLFNSPSAWAIYCKKCINPEKKSGCGWASVKYDGRKLDFYKSLWFRKHRPVCSAKEDNDNQNGAVPCSSKMDDDPTRRPVLPHSLLGPKSADHDPNTLVRCVSFSALGKMQPFIVTVSNTSLFLMDFHSHLTTSEVVGYLGGVWDITSHNLSVTRAFPCKCRFADKDSAPLVEGKIRCSLAQLNLTLVGWYHSHPSSSPDPTLRDIASQMEYQIKLKGNNDATYTPCLGIICSPFNKGNASSESNFQAYWVMPPPENKPTEYARPMMMSFKITKESPLTNELVAEMNQLRDYYKSAPDAISFKSEWSDDGTTYLEKLQNSLRTKRPSEMSEQRVNEILRELLAT